MTQVRTKLGEGGRIVIPSEYRNALGLKTGDEVIMRLAEGELRILTVREAIRKAQEIVRRYVPAGTRMVDELIAERRSEAGRE